VVHFGSILAVCLIMLAPLPTASLLGVAIVACGAFGLGYSGVARHGAVRDGISTVIDWDDRIWYALLPVMAYLCETACGVTLLWRLEVGSAALAVAMGGLLLIAVHNAWDITVWSVTRGKD
jgi:hypothetical protein